MNEANADDIKSSLSEGVAHLTISRPSTRNALTSDMYLKLGEKLRTWAKDDSVGVVVIEGSNGSFCSGNDLSDLASTTDFGPAIAFLDALFALPQPLIAAVDGPAIGVGTTMLLPCDAIVATERSTFATPFVDLGLVPEAAATLLLPRRIGPGRANRMILFGDRVTAQIAVSWGLVDEVLADGQALDSRVMELATALVEKPRMALLAARALLREETDTVALRLARDSAVLQSLLPSALARLAPA
jgi:enoyl-CoA hydratase/carnithine racemase